MRKLIFLIVLLLPLTALALVPKDATLSWDAVTTNTDGSTITDLAGYKVYCGTQTGVYNKVQDVGNVLTSKVSDILPADGTYFCAVTAYDTTGNESAYSSEVSFPLDRLAPAAPVGLKVK